MRDMCGSSVSLRCQLPTEDLDALVSITSDEDLANLIEEYDRAAAAPSSSFKIRAFLSAPKTIKKVSPPPTASSFRSRASTPKSTFRLYSAGGGIPPRSPTSATRPYKRLSSRPPTYPIISQQVAGKISHQFVYHYHIGQGNGCGVGRLIHNGNHWQ